MTYITKVKAAALGTACASYDTHNVKHPVTDSVIDLLRSLPEQSGEPVATVHSFNDLGGQIDWVSPPNYRPPVGASLYAAPQPAADVVKDAACMQFLHEAPDLTPYLQEYHSGVCLNVDAAMSAMQGVKK